MSTQLQKTSLTALQTESYLKWYHSAVPRWDRTPIACIAPRLFVIAARALFDPLLLLLFRRLTSAKSKDTFVVVCLNTMRLRWSCSFHLARHPRRRIMDTDRSIRRFVEQQQPRRATAVSVGGEDIVRSFQYKQRRRGVTDVYIQFGARGQRKQTNNTQTIFKARTRARDELMRR